MASCLDNIGQVILDASHDVVDGIPLQWVELTWVCSDQSAERQGNLIHHYSVAGKYGLRRVQRSQISDDIIETLTVLTQVVLRSTGSCCAIIIPMGNRPNSFPVISSVHNENTWFGVQNTRSCIHHTISKLEKCLQGTFCGEKKSLHVSKKKFSILLA